jgi:hypothetical protein
MKLNHTHELAFWKQAKLKVPCGTRFPFINMNAAHVWESYDVYCMAFETS